MLAYTAKPSEDARKSIWSKIGAAGSHKDGQHYEMHMDALPVDGRIVLRTIKDSDQDQTGELFEQTQNRVLRIPCGKKASHLVRHFF